MTFTGIDDSVYVVNCNGSVKDNAKNDTQDTLTISGTEVNFPELVCDVIQWLISHKSYVESSSVGAASYTPVDEERLRTTAEMWRGIRSL